MFDMITNYIPYILALSGLIAFLIFVFTDGKNRSNIYISLIALALITWFAVGIIWAGERTIDHQVTLEITPGQPSDQPADKIASASETMNWNELILTIVVGVLILGGLGFLILIGPTFLGWIKPYQSRIIQWRYLKAVSTIPQPKTEIHKIELKRDISSDVTIVTGRIGTGKSTLLRQQLIKIAKQTLNKDMEFIPVLIDLDMVTEQGLGLTNVTNKISYMSALNVNLPSRVFQQAVNEGRIFFVLDSSISLLGPNQREILEQLIDFVQYYKRCRFIVALPELMAKDFYLRIKQRQIKVKGILLNDLSRAKIRTLLKKSSAGNTELFSKIEQNTSWLNLARSPFVIFMLEKYYLQTTKLPTNLVTLLRRVVYPKNSHFSQKRLEAIFCKLAYKMINYNRMMLPMMEIEEIIRREILAFRKDKPYPIDVKVLNPIWELIDRLQTTPTVRKTAKDLINSEILVCAEVKPNKKIVQFKHPLFMAYFIALGWRSNLLSITSGSLGMLIAILPDKEYAVQ